MVQIRLVERRDAEAIRSIYNTEVAETTVTFDLVPRTLDEQVEWIDDHTGARPGDRRRRRGRRRGGRVRLALPLQGAAGVRHDGRGLGLRRRDRRGEGIAPALLEELLRLAAEYGFHSVIARIVGGHEASIALHERCGFTIVGTEREVGRKFGRWLDVVEMQRMV